MSHLHTYVDELLRKGLPARCQPPPIASPRIEHIFFLDILSSFIAVKLLQLLFATSVCYGMAMKKKIKKITSCYRQRRQSNQLLPCTSHQAYAVEHAS